MTNGLIEDLQRISPDETAVAVATLVSATGSTSKKVGTKMVVGGSGRLLGGVTIGGCVDAQVVEAADELIAKGGRRVLSISLDDDEAWEIGLTCGGNVDVLIEHVSVRDDVDPIVSAHSVARAMLARGEAVVVATPLEGRSAALVISEWGGRHGTLGDRTLDGAATKIAEDVLRSESGVREIELDGLTHRVFFDRQAPATTEKPSNCGWPR